MRLDTCKSINRRLYKWKIMHFLHLRTITMFSITGLIVACLICHIAYGSPSEQIVGGTDAPDGKYPYQVSVKYIGKHICGGAIVSNKYVITAARCLEGNPNDISVDVGTTHRSSNGNRYWTHKVIIHPDYNKTLLKNDIGLINVESEIVFNENTKSINLASNDYNLEGVDLTVTGWGRTSLNGLMSELLQQITVIGSSQQNCNHTYKFITNNHICTLRMRGGQGICEGDEGGPLTYKGELVGIASSLQSIHLPCGNNIYPNVFIRVYHYKEWVNEYINAGSNQQLNIIPGFLMMYLCIYSFS